MTVLAITGGVGGSKLALGLAKVLQSGEVVFLVNTADDFQHCGLHISPDLDTLCYTLAGRACPTRGWGRRNESWTFMETLKDLGGPSWFQLGDKDLAVHAYRTQLMNEDCSLSVATETIVEAMGIEHKVLPVSDDPITTVVESDIGDLSFQHYFVKHQCRPRVLGLRYVGANAARLNPLLDLNTISLVVICPSNPFLSIDPILAIPTLRNFLGEPDIPVVAISPIVQGRALKGPTTKIMAELGFTVSNESIATHYADFLSGLIVDSTDFSTCNNISELGIQCIAKNTVMNSLESRIHLARETLEFGRTFTR